MKSNKKQITCRRDRGYTVVWSLSFDLFKNRVKYVFKFAVKVVFFR